MNRAVFKMDVDVACDGIWTNAGLTQLLIQIRRAAHVS